jgi:hypothetical protein
MEENIKIHRRIIVCECVNAFNRLGLGFDGGLW